MDSPGQIRALKPSREYAFVPSSLPPLIRLKHTQPHLLDTCFHPVHLDWAVKTAGVHAHQSGCIGLTLTRR